MAQPTLAARDFLINETFIAQNLANFQMIENYQKIVVKGPKPNRFNLYLCTNHK